MRPLGGATFCLLTLLFPAPFPLDPPAQGPQETFKQGEVTRGLRAGGLSRVESKGKKQSGNSARE